MILKESQNKLLCIWKKYLLNEHCNFRVSWTHTVRCLIYQESSERAERAQTPAGHVQGRGQGAARQGAAHGGGAARAAGAR